MNLSISAPQHLSTQNKAAVLGHPISHSLSPKLHGYWLQHHQITGSYEAIDTPPEALKETLNSLQQQGYAGVNLTVPLKETVLPLLDSIDPIAAQIGAVNTVVFAEGEKRGYNTDAYGFMQNLGLGIRDWALGKIVVLGAGGAARAVIAGLLGAGAKEIIICNRNCERAEELATSDWRLTTAGWSDRNHILTHATLLVNTTSLGMLHQPPLEISLDALPVNALVTDVVYNPLQTALLQQAAARGNPTVDGLGMLLYQGQKAFEYFFGQLPEVTEELRNQLRNYGKL